MLNQWNVDPCAQGEINNKFRISLLLILLL